MSYKLLEFDLQTLLDRIEEATDFPYGDGDDALIAHVNDQASALGLHAPIKADIAEEQFMIEVFRWNTCEWAFMVQHSQPCWMVGEKKAFIHDGALGDSGPKLAKTLRSWLREVQRAQMVERVENERPVYPEPPAELSRLERAIYDILLERAQGSEGSAISGAELITTLEARGEGRLSDSTLSKKVKSLSAKGCPCGSRPHHGFWLMPLPCESHQR